jgi:nitrate reductase delta subunit
MKEPPRDLGPARTFQALGALLAYPEAPLVDALGEIGALLDAEGLVRRDTLAGLLGHLARTDLYTLQEDYVALFDRGRATSLNLFEHVHGDSRERGAAMVELVATYEAGGLYLATGELPDHLPVLLEFASRLPLAEARDLVGETAHILRELGDRLARRGSPYCAVPAALLAICGEDGLTEALAPRPAGHAPDAQELAAMDRAWAEAPVTFGGGAPPAEAQVHFYEKKRS